MSPKPFSPAVRRKTTSISKFHATVFAGGMMLCSVAWAVDPPEANRVTLKVPAGTTCRDAIFQFSLASHVPMATVGVASVDAMPVRGITLQDVPFWNAVSAVADATGQHWTWDQRASLRFAPSQQPSHSPWFADGCVLVRASPSWQAGVDGGRLVRIHYTFDIEPAKFPLFGSLQDSKTLAQIGQSSLRHFTPQAERNLRFDGQRATGSVDMLHTSPATTTLLDTQGEARVWLAKQRELLDFQLLRDVGTTRQLGDSRYTLSNVEFREQALLVELDVQSPQRLNWESHQQSLLHREAWHEDSEGRQLRFAGMEIKDLPGGVQRLAYRFFPPEGLALSGRFCYTAAVDIHEVTARWKLQGLTITDPAVRATK